MKRWCGSERPSLLTSSSVKWLIIAVHVGLLLHLAFSDSPTDDEPAAVAAGLSHWSFGRFDLYRVNPPLTKLIAAAPLLATPVKTDWSRYRELPGARSEFAVGQDFVAANQGGIFWCVSIARIALIPFCALGAYWIHRWASELSGPISGMIALVLWCSCPNILAHGHLVTADVAAASMAVVSTYCFAKWLEQPQWMTSARAGILLGIAFLTKSSLLLLVPAWFLVWVLSNAWWSSAIHWQILGRQLVQFCAQIVLAVLCLNIGYGFQGTGTALSHYEFKSKALAGKLTDASSPTANRFRGLLIGHIPVPLPMDYVCGIDLQKSDCEGVLARTYYQGAWHPNGVWYYYLYAFFIKTPLATLLLVCVAPVRLAIRAYHGTFTKEHLAAIVVASTIVVVVSWQTGLNHHPRYALPCVPFVYLLASDLGESCTQRVRFSLNACVSGVCAAIAATSSLVCFPHCITYFNEAVGGPSHGHSHLLGSSCDWGQGLLRLKKWQLSQASASPTYLLHSGSVSPTHAAIEFSIPESLFAETGNLEAQALPAGCYVISPDILHGATSVVYGVDGELVPLDPHAIKRYLSDRGDMAIVPPYIMFTHQHPVAIKASKQ